MSTQNQLKTIERKLDTLTNIAGVLLQGEVVIMSAIQDLETELQGLTEAVPAVGNLILRLMKLVEDAAPGEARIAAITAQVRANKDSLVAATLAGTPVEPSRGPSPDANADAARVRAAR